MDSGNCRYLEKEALWRQIVNFFTCRRENCSWLKLSMKCPIEDLSGMNKGARDGSQEHLRCQHHEDVRKTDSADKEPERTDSRQAHDIAGGGKASVRRGHGQHDQEVVDRRGDE